MGTPRTVILGATGFVAGGLVRLLEAEGEPCRPVGSREIDLTAASATGQLAAILKPQDAVVVCAALTPEKGRDRATFLKNVGMVDHLATALAAAPCAHIVYISSDSVYGSRQESVDENSCCETGDLYGLGHIVREKLLLEACAGLNIPVAILRPGAIYGADDTHNAYGPNRFARTALIAGKISLFGEGEEQRDHISIGDVARLIRLCVRQRISGTFNAVTGTALTFRDVAHAIQEACGGKVTIESVPRRVPVVHRRFDASALRTFFPAFQPTPFDTGIRETVAALQGRNVQAKGQPG
jgi:UDP-glucose 4-epimerase